jgi:two-component system NtrC family sensor kinase
MIRISFSDDDPGIPSELINRILDPFFTTKEVGKGTGLGLSICYGIITTQGGRIYAKSPPGKGATFIIELPINPL